MKLLRCFPLSSVLLVLLLRCELHRCMVEGHVGCHTAT